MADIARIRLPNEAEAREIKDAIARRVFTPATSSTLGNQGQVPAPSWAEVQAGEFLCADGTWKAPSATVAVDNAGTVTNTIVEEAILVAGTNVTITPDTTNHTVTISSTGGSGGSYTEGTGIDITDQDVINNTGILNVTSDNTGSTAAVGTITITKLNSAGTATEETQVAVKGLGSAATKGVDTTITSASTASNVPTSDVVYGFVNTNYAGKTTFTTETDGLVPASDGTGEAGMFLKGDATWATPDNTTYTVETGTVNGKIKVTPSNDTAYEVPVYGLNNAAYKDVDSTPTQNSTKLVESGGVYTALAGKLGTSDNAASAAKLNSGTSDYSVGSTSKGVYFANGVPTEMTCTVETSVPQNAVFTDTTYTGDGDNSGTGAIEVNASTHVISAKNASTSDKGVVQLTTSLPASTATEDNKVATALTVAKAIADLPEPMVFKGSVGTSGTIEWSALPTAASTNKGFTYKVITDHATAPICKEGDTIISDGSTWVVIPSGDDVNSGVTNVATEKGITTASGSAITSTGTLKLKLKSEDALSKAAPNPDTTTNNVYPAVIDSAGNVAVAVPWTDTNTTYSFTYSGTKLTISANS